MRKAWRRFRDLPTKVQAVTWVVAAVVVLGLLGPNGEPAGEVSLSAAGDADDTGDTGDTGDAGVDATRTPERELTASPRHDPTDAPSDEATEADGPAEAEPAVAAVPDGVPLGAQAGVVERIVDGDTIAVRIDADRGPLGVNATHTIRLLIMDAPETVAPGKPVECGGPEAAAFAAEHMPVGSTVYLVADREDTDRYGRFLRYVWTDDGEFFNLEAVRAGHARAVLYEPNDAHWARLHAAETDARSARRRMWGSPCSYDAPPPPPPAPEPAIEEVAPAQAPAPPPPAPPAEEPAAGCAPGYTPCVPHHPPDLDCADVDGPIQVTGSDPHGFDRDKDGIGCE